MHQTGGGFFSNFAGIARVAGTFGGAVLGLVGGGIAVVVGAPVVLALGAGVGAGALIGLGFGSVQAAAMKKMDKTMDDFTKNPFGGFGGFGK